MWTRIEGLAATDFFKDGAALSFPFFIFSVHWNIDDDHSGICRLDPMIATDS